MQAIVICIGNKARGDDGVARRVASLLEDRLPEGTELISKPQLDVVMTDRVSESDAVVFVDAERRSEPPVRVSEVELSTTASNAHSLDPGGLMALVSKLYDSAPQATLISLAAPEMPHAEGLSETAKAASEEATFAILELLEQLRERA